MKIYEFKKAKTKVTIDDTFVRLERNRFNKITNVGLNGEKTIDINSILSVKLRKPGGFTTGYLQISIPKGSVSHGTFGAPKDENSIAFTKKELPMAEEIRKIIEEQIANKSSSKLDSSEEIRKFKGLLDEGIITQEEFDAKKKQLLRI